MSVARFSESLTYCPDLNSERNEIIKHLRRYESSYAVPYEFIRKEIETVLDNVHIEDGTVESYNKVVDALVSKVFDIVHRGKQ